MRIFLSWSGDRSKYLAKCFKEWLPNVLQYVDPYMSEKDIKLGERWGKSIEENLRSNDFGLVFITPENIDAPWINFEAGALSKSLQSRLVPILYDANVTILNNGPLKQFQSSKEVSKELIKQLILDINEFAEETEHLKEERLESAFDKWWSDLDEQLKKTPKNTEIEEQKIPSNEEMLNVILHEVMNLRELNRNPIRKPTKILNIPTELLDDLEKIKFDLSVMMNDAIEFDIDELSIETLEIDIAKISRAISYLQKRSENI
ncbi:MAG: toll/interleukin-1 receptor domain-containing protein [Streptococcus salivarius]|nr:toll/interleukin-1 receptor domain-containing protein [Streptococcus salivarius]